MDAKNEILAASEQFRAAYEGGRIDVIAGYYTDDLVKLRHGAVPEGRDEVLDRVRTVFGEQDRRLEVTNDEIEASGDLAFVKGSFVLTLTPRAGGSRTEVRRRFIEIWRRENGAWRVSRAIDNAGPE
jgi:ketosteroid isomerase-like protein